MKRTPKSEEILGSLPGSPRCRVRVNRMDCSLLNSLLWMREPEGINPLLATPVCPLDQPEANTPKQARRRAFVYSFTAWEGAILPPAQHKLNRSLSSRIIYVPSPRAAAHGYVHNDALKARTKRTRHLFEKLRTKCFVSDTLPLPPFLLRRFFDTT